MSYYVKEHRSEGRLIVAICDEEILGQTFREGDIVLSVDENFYGGTKVDIEGVLRYISIADIAVVTGKRVVSELIKRGLVPPYAVLKVGEQLHVQIIREELLEEGVLGFPSYG